MMAGEVIILVGEFAAADIAAVVAPVLLGTAVAAAEVAGVT